MDQPVTITIQHPSCKGCRWEYGPDHSHCRDCYWHPAPMEHEHFEPMKRKKS